MKPPSKPPSSTTSSRAESIKAQYPLLSGGLCEETEKELKEADVRFNFMGVSVFCMVCVTGIGFMIGLSTNSDMVTVDVWNMCVDILALLLSMQVERMKKDFIKVRNEENEIENRSQVLIADAVGGCVSFALLVSVTVFGSLKALDDIRSPGENQVHNRLWLLVYAFVSMVFDVAPLSYLYFSTDASSWADSNKLNILTGIMHVSVDLLRALVTLVGSTIMLITPPSRTFDTQLDGYGSLAISVLVLASAVLVAQEALQTYLEVQSLKDEEKRLTP